MLIRPSLNIGIGSYASEILNGVSVYCLNNEKISYDSSYNVTVCADCDKLIFKGIGNKLFKETNASNDREIESEIFQFIDKALQSLKRLSLTLSHGNTVTIDTKVLVHIIVPTYEGSSLVVLDKLLKQLKFGVDDCGFTGVDVKIISLLASFSKGENYEMNFASSYKGLEFLSQLNINYKDYISNILLVDNTNRDNLLIGLDGNYLSQALGEFISISMKHQYSMFSVPLTDSEKCFSSFGISITYYSDMYLNSFLKEYLLKIVLENDDVSAKGIIDRDNVIGDTNKFLNEYILVFQKHLRAELLKSIDFDNYLREWKCANRKDKNLESYFLSFNADVLGIKLGDVKDDVVRRFNYFSEDSDSIFNKLGNSFGKNKAILGNLLGEEDSCLVGEISNDKRLNINDLKDVFREYIYSLKDSDEFISNEQLTDIQNDIANERDYILKTEKEIVNLSERIKLIGSSMDVSFNDGVFSKDGEVFNANGYKPSFLVDGFDVYSPVDGVLLPNHIDLRDSFPCVKNQEDIPACTSFALCSVYEYLANINNRKSVNVSELFLYYGSREDVREDSELVGTSIYDSLNSLQSNGMCFDNTWPFDKININMCPSEFALQEGKKYILQKTERVNIVESDFKKALNEGYPIVFGLKMYESFFDSREDGFVPYPDVEERQLDIHGRHAMVIVGFSENDKYFIVRNSWGKTYGDDGYVYIPYDYLANEEYCDEAYILNEIVDLSDFRKIDSVHNSVTFSFMSSSDKVQYNIKRYNLMRAKKDLLSLENKYSFTQNRYITQNAEIDRPKKRKELFNNSVKEVEEKKSSLINDYNSSKKYFEFKKSSLRKIIIHALKLLLIPTLVIVGCVFIEFQYKWGLIVLSILSYILLLSLYIKKILKQTPKRKSSVDKKFLFDSYVRRIEPLEFEIFNIKRNFKITNEFLCLFSDYENEIKKEYIDKSDYYSLLCDLIKKKNREFSEELFSPAIFSKSLIRCDYLEIEALKKKNFYIEKWVGFNQLFNNWKQSVSNKNELLRVKEDLLIEIDLNIERLIEFKDDFKILSYLLNKFKYDYLPEKSSIDSVFFDMEKTSSPFIQLVNYNANRNSTNECFFRDGADNSVSEFDRKLKCNYPTGGPNLLSIDSSKKIVYVKLEFLIEMDNLVEYRKGKAIYDKITDSDKKKVDVAFDLSL